MEKCSTMENERILEKIEELMAQHEYTKYKLAKLSGIKKSTITTIFTKRSTVSVYNLSKMCKAFDLTLSEFFAMLEGEPRTDKIQNFPVEWWRSLQPETRRKVSAMMFTMAELVEKGS